MSGRVLRIDIPAHQAVQELLPWYASGQLAPDEMRRVYEHLRGCAQCREDLEWEHDMYADAARSGAAADALPGGVNMDPALARLMPPEGVDMEAALARLMPALGPQERGDQHVRSPSPAPRSPWWRAAAANQPSWLRWAVAAQWVLIVGLAGLLLRPSVEADAYHVLGSGVAAGGNLVVVFQPNTSERELRNILQAQNARVVDGPTVTDAYLINVPAAGRDQALRALRAEAAVKLAEPLDAGGTP